MPTKPPRRHTFFDHIYLFYWCVQRGGTKLQAAKWYCSKTKTPLPEGIEDHPSYTGWFYTAGAKNGLIWLSEKAGTGTVSHECLHATHFVGLKLQTTLTDSTEEVYAYYIDYLTRTIVNKLFY